MDQITPIVSIHVTNQEDEAYLETMILNHEGNNYHFPGRTGDRIYVFVQSICIYVLSINRRQSNINLYAFMAPETDYINSVSLHSIAEIKSVLGSSWGRMQPKLLVDKLVKCMC